MKYVLSCVFSAVLGALIALTLNNPQIRSAAFAVERPVERTDERKGPVLPESTRPRVPAHLGAGRDERPHELGSPLGPDELSREEQINIAVYENVNRSVVHITTRGVRGDRLFMLEVPTEGSGSGSILDNAGHIVTNNHVIDAARQVQVTLADGQSYEARFVGADPINDVAVIKIDAPPAALHPVVLGDSRRLRVGMRVFAIGNPFGLERTLTSGIISSLNRSLQLHEGRSIKSIIQIDAAINPGNSGGPLLDTHGRLIGMNTAIASKTGQSAGVGFALPVSHIARIVPQLIERGRVIRPEIGISKVYETEHGLLIFKLIPGGPAERAGLRGPQLVTRRRGPFVVESVDRTAADLIIAVDDQKVASADDFLSVIEAKAPGSQVTLTVVRQGNELSVPVMLGGDDVVPAPLKTRP
ncbi:MAG: trypsin-like serine protease [Planctomycetaceae bacterium]|nr:trypsin-like serine protease [Planctomycetaceae bacterium]